MDGLNSDAQVRLCVLRERTLRVPQRRAVSLDGIEKVSRRRKTQTIDQFPLAIHR